MKNLKARLFLSIIFSLLMVVGCSKNNSIDQANIQINGTKALTQVTSFGSNPGNIDMYLHVPSDIGGDAPVVIALHGCTQTAAQFDTGNEWSKLADRYKFIVIFPQQKSANNGYSCFNWGGDSNGTLSDMDPAGTIRRGSTYTWSGGTVTDNPGDESGSIMQMLDYVKANYSVDDSKVFVTGLSAGGYMTALLLAVYPDVFAAGAPMSGGPYLCNRTSAGKLDSNEAYGCMSPGKDQTPQQWGDVARAYNGYDEPGNVVWPRIQIWQGSSDYTVMPVNAEELVDQFTNLHGIDNVADETTTLNGHAYKKYTDGSNSLVEYVSVTGMGHATSIDPGTGEDQGGSTGGNYTADKDVWAAYYAWQFFNVETGPQPLSVNIASPANAATLLLANGSAVIQAVTTGENTITKVEFYVNGIKIGEDTSAPFEITWSYSAVGSYSLKAVVTDDTSDTEVDDDTTVTVSEFQCTTITATNYEHVNAGRAEAGGLSSLYAITVGGGDDLGLVGSEWYSITTTVSETTLGYYKQGECGVAPPADTEDPAVNLTAPANNATLSATVTVSADASDNIGVTKVEFYAGSTKIGEDTSAPYSISWDTTSIANGSYTVKAKAFDAAGNNAEDADTSVTVDNGSTGCTDYTATNAEHTTAGRATMLYNILHYAVGSNDYLGISTATTTIKEMSSGYFELGSCD